ncbi:hypothetical protein MPSEU_000191000 [Mayamaea pseudoterrestris]|nr:hypothetical protein MPSEU_000191000 [Mayamaea pseudoterrestris]
MTGRLWLDAIKVCVLAGDHQAAEAMLYQIEKPNIRHYTAYLKVLLMDSSRLQAGLDFLNHMSGRGNASSLPPVAPNHITMRTVLGACERNYSAAIHIIDNMKQGMYGKDVLFPDEACYNLAIASCQTPEQARELVMEMRLTRRHRIGVAAPTARTITQALVICRRTSDVAMARYFIKQASMDGIKPDLYMYSAAIATAASAKDSKAARFFWKDMLAKNLAPNVITYNCMIGAHTSCNDVNAAINLFQKMNETRTRTTFGYMAKALFTITDNVMKIVYIQMITDTMTRNDWKAEIGGPVIEATINAYGALGCYTDARAFYDKIEGPADAACLRAMLFACSTAQPQPQWQDALDMLHSSDILTGTRGPMYMDPMAAQHDKGRQDRNEGKTTVQSAADKDQSLQWWECAVSLLSRMWEQGLQPDIQIFSSVISACEAAGEWQHALSILQSVLDSAEGSPQFLNLYCFNAAISACEKGGAWVEALEIYERMKAYGGIKLQPSIVTIGSLILAFDKAGQKELAQIAYDEGRASGAFNPWRMTIGANGERIKALDLHRFNTAMARTAIRSYLESLLAKGSSNVIEEDLVIVVGKGKHSSDEPVLASAACRLLKNEYKIAPAIDDSNPGRVIIRCDELNKFIARKSWR